MRWRQSAAKSPQCRGVSILGFAAWGLLLAISSHNAFGSSDSKTEREVDLVLWKVHQFFVCDYVSGNDIALKDWDIRANQVSMSVETALANLLNGWCQGEADIVKSYVAGGSADVDYRRKIERGLSTKKTRMCQGGLQSIVLKKRADIGVSLGRNLGKTVAISFRVVGKKEAGDKTMSAVLEDKSGKWKLVRPENDVLVSKWRFSGKEETVRIDWRELGNL